MIRSQAKGFTLIELSIVLVIIGLVIGGVLVGQDLISAAAIRAQVSQIEKYNTAVNTFRGKYGDQLPGDMLATQASMFGFATRTGAAGHGDGNGILEGWGPGARAVCGETAVFWNDLSVAGLLDGQFASNIDSLQIYTVEQGGVYPVSTYLPQAKIGNTNYVYVWSGGYGAEEGDNSGKSSTSFSGLSPPYSPSNDINYFTVSALPAGLYAGWPMSAPGLSVAQAYAIDKKIDDGYPQSGKVTAMYPNLNVSVSGLVLWSLGGCGSNECGSAPSIANPNNTAPTASNVTCYDDGGSLSIPMQYSMGYQNGAGINCALSFQFQ